MKKLISFYMLMVAFMIFFALPTDAKETKEIKGQTEESGSATDSSGVDTGVSPGQPGLFGIESSSCNYWWVYGQHTWKWRGVPYVWISYSSYGKSWTEYGTSTGGCGIPLTVDRIYVRVTEYPLNSYYSTYDNTAYNTNFVDRGNSGFCVVCPNLCGVKSFHEATKSGVTWNATVRSGCAQ